MNRKIVPVTLLTGYLGAGKTTLLNHILSNQKGFKIAVIVNDIGEVNIDASLISSVGVVSQKDNNLVPLQNGCICCTLKEDLMQQIISLASSNLYDYILIEASGICEPVPIAQTIQYLADYTEENKTPFKIKLDNVVTVVDAARLANEFGSGRDLLNKEIEDDDIENLLIQQIEFCNKIVINKVDDVKKEELEEVISVIKALQPEAEILKSNYGVVGVEKILATNAFDFDKASLSAAWIKELNATDNEEEENEHHGEGEILEYDIATFVYYRRKPLDHKLFQTYTKNLPTSVIRIKGVTWYAADNKNMYMFEKAGKQISSMNAGPWVASLPKNQQIQILSQNIDIKNEWDDKLGDRLTKLVFIGKNMNINEIIKSLDSCLVEPKI